MPSVPERWESVVAILRFSVLSDGKQSGSNRVSVISGNVRSLIKAGGYILL